MTSYLPCNMVTTSSHEDDDLSVKMSLPFFRGPGELYPYFTNRGCGGGGRIRRGGVTRKLRGPAQRIGQIQIPIKNQRPISVVQLKT